MYICLSADTAGAFPIFIRKIDFILDTEDAHKSLTKLKDENLVHFDVKTGEGILLEHCDWNNPYKSSSKHLQRYLFDRRSIKSGPLKLWAKNKDKELKSIAQEKELVVKPAIVKTPPIDYGK